MNWKCPNCENEIEYLEYRVTITGTEYGTIDLSSDTNDRLCEHSSEDDSYNRDGDYTYTCPNCDDELNPEDLIWISKEKVIEEIKKEIIEEKLEEEEFDIIKPKENIFTNKIPVKSDNLICKKCFHAFVIESNYMGFSEDFFDCPKCGTPNTIDEYKKLIEENHYN